MILTQQTGWIGVDIGARSVKMAQLTRRKGRLRLAAAQIVHRLQPWSAGDSSARALRDSADEITAGVSLCPALRGRVAASMIPQAACSFQTLVDAFDDDAQRRTAVVRELAAQYGGPPDSFVFDCWNSDYENPAARNLLVLSSTDEWARRVSADHAASGLRCNVLDGAPFALARAIELASPGGSATPQGVLDWGYSQATFCVVLRQQPLFVRRLSGCALQLLVEALRERLAVTFDEAHRLLAAHGAPGDESASRDEGPAQLVWTIIQEKLNVLVDELDRTLCYLETHRRRLVPDMLWLFGGGAALPNIEHYLHAAIDLPSRSWTLGALQEADGPPSPPPPLIGPALALSSLAWTRK